MKIPNSKTKHKAGEIKKLVRGRLIHRMAGRRLVVALRPRHVREHNSVYVHESLLRWIREDRRKENK